MKESQKEVAHDGGIRVRILVLILKHSNTYE